jgi:hypothetical protein
MKSTTDGTKIKGFFFRNGVVIPRFQCMSVSAELGHLRSLGELRLRGNRSGGWRVLGFWASGSTLGLIRGAILARWEPR